MTEHGEPAVVRTAGMDDARAVLHVYAQRDPGGEIPTGLTDLQRTTWAQMMQTKDLTVYLAEIDGRPVGTAMLLAMPNLTYNCAPTAFIEAVVVAHDHRRRGIASAIVRRMLRDAGSLGCNKVQLLSHKRHANDGAHTLYTSLGFEAEAEGFRLYLGASR